MSAMICPSCGELVDSDEKDECPKCEAVLFPDDTERLKALQLAVHVAFAHIVDHGRIELGTAQSKALRIALQDSQK